MSIIKITVKPRVYGNPIRLLDPFGLIKTILFINIIYINNTICEELQSKIIDSVEQFKAISEYESPDESEAKMMRQKLEAEDIKLNKQEVEEGKYWVNGQWIERKNENYKKVNGMWIYDNQNTNNTLEKSNSEIINKEPVAIRKAKNIATFSMEGCEQGFHFPAISKDVLPIGIMSTSMQGLNALK